MVKKQDIPNPEFIALEAAQRRREKKIKQLNRKSSEDFDSSNRGVVFLKNIPHGFYEKEMRKYFSQFGDVKRLQLARNTNGESKGFAYIEFLHEEVAKIVAETMNNYLMYNCCLKCEVVPLDDVPESAFRTSAYIKRPYDRGQFVNQLNRPRSKEQLENRKERAEKKLESLKQRMVEMGIKYDWGDLKADPKFVPPARETGERPSRDWLKHASIREQFKQWVNDFDFYQNTEGKCVFLKDPNYVPKPKKKKMIKKIGKQKRKAPPSDGLDSGVGEDSSDVNEVEGPKKKKAEKTKAAENFTVHDLKMEESLNTTPEIVIDPNEEEITFKTPPQSVKVKKRILSSVSPELITPKRSKLKTPTLSAKMKRRQRVLKMRQMLSV